MRETMTAQDDMKTALAGLAEAVTAENTKIDSLAVQLGRAATNAGVPLNDVEGYVSQISAITAGINAKLGSPEAPAPAPIEAAPSAEAPSLSDKPALSISGVSGV
jgi:methionine synthase I (cobalamin-dependent)